MKHLQLLFLSLLFYSCNLSNEDDPQHTPSLNLNKSEEVEPDTIYNAQVADFWWRKNDTIKAVLIDTLCISHRTKARKDIENLNICYYSSKFRSGVKEMADLLQYYNITLVEIMPGCLGQEFYEFKFYCYEEEMHHEIHKKFGENLIDSLWKIAEKRLAIKYPDSLNI